APSSVATEPSLGAPLEVAGPSPQSTFESASAQSPTSRTMRAKFDEARCMKAVSGGAVLAGPTTYLQQPEAPCVEVRRSTAFSEAMRRSASLERHSAKLLGQHEEPGRAHRCCMLPPPAHAEARAPRRVHPSSSAESVPIARESLCDVRRNGARVEEAAFMQGDAWNVDAGRNRRHT